MSLCSEGSRSPGARAAILTDTNGHHYSTSTLHRKCAKRCSNGSHCGYCSEWTHWKMKKRSHDDALSSSSDPLITWYCNSRSVPNSTSRARFRFKCLLSRISFIWFTGTNLESMRNLAEDKQTVLRLVPNCPSARFVPNFLLVAWSWLYHCSKLALYCHSEWPLSGRSPFSFFNF